MFAAARPAAAADDDPRVAVLPLSIVGSLEQEVDEQLQERLVGALSRGSLEVIDPEAVLEAEATAASCEDSACYRKVAEATSADHVVSARLTVDGRDYEIGVEVFDADGSVVASARDTCEICGLDEVSELMDDLAASVQRKLGSTTGVPTLIVRSNLPGSLVTIDGEAVGVTPLELTLAPGEHEVRVSKDGHVSQWRKVAAVEGVEEVVTVRLEPTPSRAPRWLPWTAIGTGAAALGTGVALLAIHLRPIERDCAADADGDCRWLHNTMASGATITAVGAALVATGVTLLVVRRPSGRLAGSKRARLQPARSGVALSF